MPLHKIDELLAKFLAGEASEVEEREVATWLEDSDASKQYLAHFSLIWQQGKEDIRENDRDAAEAWKRFKKRREEEERNAVPVKRIGNRSLWLKIAAVFILAAGYLVVSKNLFKKVNITPTEIAQVNRLTDNETLIDTLPDGSVATLNKHSAINYPSAFIGHQRNVTLKGEAFFTVTPNKEKPFIIAVNNIVVKVVGTSFNIKSVGSSTTVTVATGKVQIITNDDSLFLLPGEEVVVARSDTALIKKARFDKFYDYYFTKSFVCDNTPLWQLTTALENAYGVKIVIEKNSLRNLRLTTTFHQQPLDTILKIIAETFGIVVDKKAGKIILR